MLIITLPEMILIVVLGVLIALLISTCMKSTKSSFNTDALKTQLRSLQLKFVTAALINPELERKEMEILQNKVKTSSHPLVISDDYDLKLLFDSNCKYIQSEMNNTDLTSRSSWIKFRDLMLGFDDLYFRA